MCIMCSLPRPGGGCEVLFSPGLSVCLRVCVSVCPANILIFYFSATGRGIDLKLIQDTYRVGASREMTSQQNISIFDFNM